MSMYGIDESLAGSFSLEKNKGSLRTPKYPDKVEGRAKLSLLNVTKGEGYKAGTKYTFTVKCTESFTDDVVAGRTYEFRFYPGASPMDKEQFWKKITPILAATFPQEGELEDFNTLEALGEAREATDALGKGEVLALPFECDSFMNTPTDKDTGKPKYFDKQGSPRSFRRDNFYAS